MRKKLTKKLIIIIFVIIFLILFLMFRYEKKSNNVNNKKVKEDEKVSTNKKTLYAYIVPKIKDTDFNNYYELNKDSDNKYNLSYNVYEYDYFDENKLSDSNLIIEDTSDISLSDLDINISDYELKKDIAEDKENEEALDDKKEDDNKNKSEEINKIEDNNSKEENDINDTNVEEKEDIINNKKNGFIEENGNTYYYENDVKITGLKNINGVNNYFTSNGVYLGTNNIKVIDVSYHQGKINWDLVASSNSIYGVILRVGYYNTLDKSFVYNLNEVKRLNIPYGIYLFSYATTINGANKESLFVNKMIKDYDLKPSLGIYYDLEGWKAKNSSSDIISKDMYDNISNTFIYNVKKLVGNNFDVFIYSGRWYAMNRLGALSKSYVRWVAEYNKTCKYDGSYFLWQYTSKGKIPGINGNVDISYIL